jgi:hypothetical protein
MAAAIRLSQQHSCSLYHLVRKREQFWRHFQPERPRSLEIDDQLEFGGLLDRKLAGICAGQNFGDVVRGAPIEKHTIGSVAHAPSATNGVGWA